MNKITATCIYCVYSKSSKSIHVHHSSSITGQIWPAKGKLLARGTIPKLWEKYYSKFKKYNVFKLNFKLGVLQNTRQ